MKVFINEPGVKAALFGTMMLAIVSATSIANAGEQGKECKHGMTAEMHGKPGRHMARALSLTENQQQTLKDQHQSSAETRKQLREQIRVAEQGLKDAVISGASDNRLQELADQLGKLKATAALERAKSHKAFLAVLTPEQKEKYEQLKAEHKGKTKGWREKHREHHSGDMDS